MVLKSVSSDASAKALRPVILCGGKGTRLWPLSRELHPKQFIELDGDVTLLGATLDRLAGLHTDETIVICNNDHRFLAAQELTTRNMPGTVVLEPVGRNTAPAVAVAALQADPDQVLLVLPSDHKIDNGKAFENAVALGVQQAEDGKLVCFGVKPRSPEVNYGYLRRGQSFGDGVFEVLAFEEKPDKDTAEKYVQSGEHYWNSGMFLFQAGTYVEALEQLAPEILAACRESLTQAVTDIDFLRLGEDAFKACPADSIDYAVMEKSTNLSVVELDAFWSDMGSWTAIRDCHQPDSDGNVTVGDVLQKGSKNCFLHSRGGLLATIGLEDAVVVRTDDAVLVASNDSLHEIRGVVDTLMESGRREASLHSVVYRPWGSYQSIAVSERFQVKRIIVKPGQILSLQKHHHRAEHWVVVKGTAVVVNGDKELTLTEDQSTYIPIGNIHRLHNPGTIPLEIIEVQTGSYLGEDDIVRLEDVYGRQGEAVRPD